MTTTKIAKNAYNEHSCRIEYIDPFLQLLGWDVANSKGLAPQYRGEVGNIMLPVVNDIDEALKKELLERIDTIVRNDEDIEVALGLVDQRLLVEVLGIDKNICTSCRQIWKKIQKRRLGRG